MAASEVAGILVRWLLEGLMLTLIFSATCEGTAVTLMGFFKPNIGHPIIGSLPISFPQFP